MDIRPGHPSTTPARAGRGSGERLRQQRRDTLGPRKAIIIRLSEETAHQLKVVAAYEKMTTQDFCEQAIVPCIREAMAKHGLSAEQISR